jgi:hypothetical protein
MKKLVCESLGDWLSLGKKKDQEPDIFKKKFDTSDIEKREFPKVSDFCDWIVRNIPFMFGVDHMPKNLFLPGRKELSYRAIKTIAEFLNSEAKRAPFRIEGHNYSKFSEEYILSFPPGRLLYNSITQNYAANIGGVISDILIANGYLGPNFKK